LKLFIASIIQNHAIAHGIYEMVIHAPEIALHAVPGQFVNLYPHLESTLLPRPISISDVDYSGGHVHLAYALVGTGTKLFATLRVADTVTVLGPLGNGYAIPDSIQNPLLVAGGVGTPPMIFLARSLRMPVMIYLGFRSSTPYFVERLAEFGVVRVATEDGSDGYKGNVVNLMDKHGAEGDIVYSCGPRPMLKAVQEWSKSKHIPTQLSLEERMGCGIGSCVGCIVKIKENNYQGWNYKKVCHDGPVFLGEKVIFS